MDVNVNRLPTATLPSRGGDRNRLLRTAAYLTWASFITLCLGLSISRGLACADDSYFAGAAKSLATGVGYATTYGSSTDATTPLQFDPYIGAGPTMIVPCALLLKLFGTNETLPGICAVLLWAGLFTIVVVRVDHEVASGTFLGGIVLFCMVILALFAYHFEQWWAFLGEIPVAALLVLAHWIAAMERPSAKSLLLCGLLLGLSVQAKHLAALATPGLFLILAFRFRRESISRATCLKWLGLCLLGCLIPTLIYESFKFRQLGLAGYVGNWEIFLATVREKGVDPGHQPFWARVQISRAVKSWQG